MDPTTSLKAYWSILKTFLNKKIPCIPLLYHNNNYITVQQRKLRSSTISLLSSARKLTILANFRQIPLKEKITFFELSPLLKMVLQKSLKILI